MTSMSDRGKERMTSMSDRGKERAATEIIDLEAFSCSFYQIKRPCHSFGEERMCETCSFRLASFPPSVYLGILSLVSKQNDLGVRLR